MPTYGYRCSICAHEFERVQKMTDPALTECESCGGAVKKIIYPVGIQFKGSGFYVNDYAKSAPKSEGDSTTVSEPAASTETDSAKSGTTAETPAPAPAKTEPTGSPAVASPAPTTTE